MPFHIIRHDITKVKADAIVNTANPLPVIGSGTDSAVYEAAGKDELLAARMKIGKIAPGQSAYTPAFGLAAKYIIHSVGTLWDDGTHGEWEILRSCYKTALALASQLKCKSIAFPLMATGAYGYPKAEALNVALQEIGRFRLKTESKAEDMDIYLVVFDKQSLELSGEEFDIIEQYIDDNYVTLQREREYMPDSRAMRRFQSQSVYAPNDRQIVADDILDSESDTMNEYLRVHKGKSFGQTLMKYIIASGMENAEVYKKANIDRKLFSKIIGKNDYTPRTDTIISLALALELNIIQTDELLKSAGRAFSGSERDLLLRACIEHKIYDIIRIDTLLFERGLDTLT